MKYGISLCAERFRMDAIANSPEVDCGKLALSLGVVAKQK
jgi:hypothetical protein